MRAAIVYKISIWEIYSESPDEETRAYLERGGKNLETLRRSSGIQKETLERTREALDMAGIEHELFYRAELTSENIADRDLVISVGGDGTFLEASHAVPTGIPMLGVNSDPERSTGFFSATDGAGVADFIAHLAHHERTAVNRLQVLVDGEPRAACPQRYFVRPPEPGRNHPLPHDLPERRMRHWEGIEEQRLVGLHRGRLLGVDVSGAGATDEPRRPPHAVLAPRDAQRLPDPHRGRLDRTRIVDTARPDLHRRRPHHIVTNIGTNPNGQEW